MIDLTKHENLLDERVNVLCTDGQIIMGEWIDWTSAQDNEPDPESITILKTGGILVEVFVNEIAAIHKAYI